MRETIFGALMGKRKSFVTEKNLSIFSVFFEKYFPIYFSAKSILILKKIFYLALHVIWLGVGSSCQVKTKFAVKCNKYLQIICNIKKHKLMRRLLNDVYENIWGRIGAGKKIYLIHYRWGVFIMSYRLKNVSTRHMFLKKYFFDLFLSLISQNVLVWHRFFLFN